MADPIKARKSEHIRAIEADPLVERGGSGFDRLRLTHRALPDLNLDEIDLSCEFMGKTLSMPLVISSMTGGAGDEILTINRNLARAAEACGVALAVGSQRVMFVAPEARRSFDLRSEAPNAVLLGNVGAVQLNYGFGVDECQAAMDVLQADGLYLHLNPLQEAVQPEGDRNFKGLMPKIAEVAAQCPVLLKEVGSGLSARDIEAGLAAGVRHFDVAGRGGTSWSRIEYHRRAHDADDIGLLFQDWGLTTVESVRAARPILDKASGPTTLIASGGVRNGIDMAKALILGADLCGIAAPFLAAAQESTEAVIAQIERLRREMSVALFLLGCGDIAAAKNNSELIEASGHE